MAAELHLAEDALALHLLLQHPEGLIDIVVTDENLHAAFLSIERLMGPMAKAPGATGARICTILVSMARTVRANVDILKSCLPMGTGAANYKSEDFGRSPLFRQLFRQVSACLCILNGRAGDKEQ